MDTRFWVDVAGWIGAIAYLTAYALVSTRKLHGDALCYQALNLVGGVLMVVNSLYYRALPSVGVNVVWIGIALLTLARRRPAARV